ncbi:DUF262 domain-containing protein [Lactiplantibacillus daowaiensis]|uniref:DUF262 domain-containing protein n=2 Tax=Lactiplantibacillus TaxID=2767842 RepID=A0ABW1S4T9_9LACO|nr:DUF262 domain-containing protein [Lactiplantibacillus daowaiensis]
MAGNLSFTQYSLEALFKEVTNMAIPIYQRGYAWGADQVDDLWNDLMEVMDDNQVDHFFGQIVMNSSNEKQYIIDGQQRLTTVTIFFAVIRDALLALAEADDQNGSEAKIRANDLQEDIIGNRLHYHLVQSDSVRAYFDKYIQTPQAFVNAPKTQEQSLKNINQTFTLLQKHVAEMLHQFKTSNERLNYLKMLYKHLTQSFFVITIVTPDEAAAFVIFETLNARGRDLNASDLLKNHVFRTAQYELETVQTTWNQMMDRLNNDSGMTTRFIRAYWNATRKFATEKALYKAIHSRIGTSSDAITFAEELNRLADVFVAMTSPKNNAYFEDEQVIVMLGVLKDMGGKTFYPLVLAMIKNGFTEADLLPVLHKIYSFIVYNFTVGGLVANKYEKMFSMIAEQVNDHRLKTVVEINEAIAVDMLSTSQFKASWAHFQAKTEKVAKHLLFETYYQAEQDLIDINAVKVLTLNEHIENANQIGNKVLVTKEENVRIRKQNQPINEVLAESKLASTRMMAKVKQMDDDLVTQRQLSVLNTAVNVWC